MGFSVIFFHFFRIFWMLTKSTVKKFRIMLDLNMHDKDYNRETKYGIHCVVATSKLVSFSLRKLKQICISELCSMPTNVV